MAIDTNFNNVSLLLHCDGTDAATTFTDNSPVPKTVTANGNAQIDTAQSKFGGASALFDGTGDYLLLPNDASLNNFGAGDFTIEFWVKVNSLAAANGILSAFTTWTSSVAYYLSITTTGAILFRAGNSIPISISSSAGAITVGPWYHIAVCRASGTTTLYIDGTAVGTPHTGSVTISNSVAPRIGQASDSTDSFNGWLDDFRITKGVARYTTTFTPPTEAFPDSGPSSETILTSKLSKGRDDIYNYVLPINFLYF